MECPTLHEAVETLRELLQFGSHEGECDNADETGTACQKHKEAFIFRQMKATALVRRYDGAKANEHSHAKDEQWSEKP